MPEHVIVCVGSANGGNVPVGLMLQSYDPDWRPSRAVRRANGYPDHQTGKADWTGDPEEAMRFPTKEAAHACWRAQSKVKPLRPDGQPNRPLTAYHVTVEPLEETTDA